MKHIKTLAVIALFFAMNVMSAQTSAKNWPALNSVKEVAARIDNNIKNNNPGAFYFSETLRQTTLKLASSEVPAEYKNKKTQETLKTLQTKTEELDAKAKAKGSVEELKTQFAEIQALLASLTETKATKATK